MPLSSAENVALFPFDVGFLGEEGLPPIQSPFSDSQSDLNLPFELDDARRPSPHTATQLQDPCLTCNRGLGWNIDWAVAFVVDRLEQIWTDAAASLRNIRLRAAELYQDGLRQEVPLYIFDKLDRLLFAGHLKNAVFLDASSLSASVSGITYAQRRGPNPEIKRFSIILNRDVLRNSQPRDIVATLIHHMIHAYFLVACGGQKEDEVSYGRLAHEVHFGKIILTIKRLSAAHGKEMACLDYRHRSPGIQHLADKYLPFWRGDGTNREDRNAWYCSHCHCNVQGPSESEVDRWYKKVCKPMFDQPHSVRKLEVHVYNHRSHKLEKICRARMVSSANSVEFLFKERPVLVETVEIERFESIMRAFDRAGSRFLKVHRDVSEDTLMRFLEFLHTGSYRLDPQSFAAAAVVVGLDPDHKGHPVIKHQGAFTEAAVFLADVQFAKLNTQMGFEDCKRYALDRMNTYGIMYEDPVAVLKEIYRGDELDSDLKAWARKFLTRTPAPSSPACHHNHLMRHGTMELPNLLKLESHSSPYRSRFLYAIDSNEALQRDVDRARVELQARGWYPSPGLPVDRPRSFSARHDPIPYPPFGLDSSSLSSASSGSWHSIRNLTIHSSCFHVDHTLEKESDHLCHHGRIEINHDDVEASRGFREEQRHRDVDRELERARERVRRLERKK